MSITVRFEIIETFGANGKHTRQCYIADPEPFSLPKECFEAAMQICDSYAIPQKGTDTI